MSKSVNIIVVNEDFSRFYNGMYEPKRETTISSIDREFFEDVINYKNELINNSKYVMYSYDKYENSYNLHNIGMFIQIFCYYNRGINNIRIIDEIDICDLKINLFYDKLYDYLMMNYARHYIHKYDDVKGKICYLINLYDCMIYYIDESDEYYTVQSIPFRGNSILPDECEILPMINRIIPVYDIGYNYKGFVFHHHGGFNENIKILCESLGWKYLESKEENMYFVEVE